MQCPRCDTENREGAKFCLKCEASLVPVCPQCGTELPTHARFCDICGTQVAAPPPDTMAERLQHLVPKQFAQRLLALRGELVGQRRIV